MTKGNIRNASLQLNTVGAVAVEQVLAVIAIGLLGVGGFIALGRGMDQAIAGDTKGSAMVTAAEAGKGAFAGVPGEHAPDDNLVHPVTPAGPSVVTSAAAAMGKTGNADGKASAGKTDGKPTANRRGFFGRLVHSYFIDAPPRVLGWVGRIYDAVLPGHGLLPGNILDGILPGHGFVGKDGFLTRALPGPTRIVSTVGDWLGWNDDVHAEAQLKKYGAEDVYTLSNFNRNLRLNRLNQIDELTSQKTLTGKGPNPSAEEIEAALRTLKEMEEGDSVDAIQQLVRSLDKKGAHDAADLFRNVVATLKQNRVSIRRQRAELEALAKKSTRKADPAVAEAMSAVDGARTAVALSKKNGKAMPLGATEAFYVSLKRAENSLVLAIEGYDAALSEMTSPSNHASLQAQRDKLKKTLDIVGDWTGKLMDRSIPHALSRMPDVTPAANIGSAAVQEAGSAQVTRTGN